MIASLSSEARGPRLWMPRHELFRQEAGSCPADEVGFVGTDGPGPPLQSHWKPLQWLLAQPLGFQAMIFMWGVSESFSVSPGHSDITCRLHLTFATHQKSEGLWICKLCRWANPTISWLLTSHQPIQPVAPQSAVAGANAARAPQKRSARPTWSRPKVRAHNDMLYYFILYHLISYIISSYIRLFI